MQKISPYIFPLIVTAIVFFLVFRWFESRDQNANSLDYGEGIEIENLSETEASDLLTGAEDLTTTPLQAPETSQDSQFVGSGSIRYEITDERVRFSVLSALPETDQPYRVWIRTDGEENLTEAFELMENKGGYQGTAAVSTDMLPLEVILSTAENRADVMDQVLLRGIITAPESSGQTDETQADEMEESSDLE